MKKGLQLSRIILDILFRLGLGGTFIYAAWMKIQDPALFAHAVASYRLLPDILIGIFALVLPMLELIAGIVLIATKWSKEAALILAMMLVMFLIGLIQAAARGLDISCGCFGDESEQSSIGIVIVRDLILLCPAIWLSLRPNRWIVDVSRPSAIVLVLISITFSVTSIGQELKSTVSAQTNSIQPEVWTKNFPAALAQAKSEHRPIVMMASKANCPYCYRLRKAMSEGSFKTWLTGTGIYLAEAHFNETNDSPEQAQLVQFVNALPHKASFPAPQIGVYWSNLSNDEVRAAFVGIRGRMPGKKDPALIVELASALDNLLSKYFASQKGHTSLNALVEKSTKHILAATKGDGKVTMTPASGELKDNGIPVILKAKAGRRKNFVGWIGPDGKYLPKHLPRLTITHSMPPGTYTAVFE